MSARQEEPCITLETEWGKNDVDKELVKQKFEESEETEVTDDKGTKTKKFKKISGYVRTFMGNNVERLINTTWLDFHQVRQDFSHWNGETLFNEFGRCLRQDAQLQYQTLLTTKYANMTRRTATSFDEMFKQYLTIIAGSENQRDTCIYYLTHVKKPMDMNPKAWLVRWNEMYNAIKMLEGLGAIPNDHTEKEMLYHTFPGKYTKHFREAGKILADMTKVKIVAYFDTLYLEDKKLGVIPRKPKKPTSDDDGKENDHAKNRNKNRVPRGGPRNGGGRGSYNGGRGGNNNNAPCQIHNGHHSWADCNQNRNSRNYKPPNNNNGHRGNGGGRGNGNDRNKNKNQDAHHNDEDPKPKKKVKIADQHHIDVVAKSLFDDSTDSK